MRTIKKLLAAMICVILANLAAGLPAQTSPVQALPALVRSARNAFRPLTQSDLNRRRAELAAAVERLDRYLATGGANGNNWKRFLRWDEMRAELQRGLNADIDVLDEVQTLYTSGHAGFEMPIYADVGRALRRYIDALDTFRNPEARSHYEARIDALAADVDAYLRNSAADTHRAGMILGELAASGQAPQIIQAVRRQMSHPNILIEADEQIVAGGIANPVNDVGPVTDVILGTRICGTVQTVGYVDAELGNTSHYAAIDILMLGTAYSRTVGYNGPAVIHSNGVTGLAGRKRLILDQYGMRTYPAASNARTRTTITGVGVTARFLPGLVQKIANKRVYQSKSQAEAIAGRRAQARLNTRMDAQSLNLIAQANRDFWTKFRNPLLRVGAFPERINFSTSGDRMRIQATRADAYQIGAPAAAPQTTAPAAVTVRLHQSTVNNFGATVLAGRTVTRDEMNRLMTTMTGKIPEELQDEEERDWSITFAVERPIELAIDEGGLSVTIRGDEYTSGDNAYPAMNVTARYQLQKNDLGGVRAVRQGELEIYPPDFKPGEDQLSSSQQSLKTILERRFGKIFKPELPDKPTAGLELGGRWKELGPLPLVALSANDGWLSLGWNKSDAAATARVAAAIPQRTTK
ncbi:MAG: hypothetical protein WD894_26595 [Pirellulales bacterium]